MALDMTTALTIRAKVDGANQIDGLSRSLGGAASKADGLAGSFGRLRGVAGGIGGALGGLVPAAGIAGLTALAKRSIDAADNLNDLSQRTGVGVEALSKFGAAANDSGSSVEEVGKAMSRLAKGVVDPASSASKALAGVGISAVDAQGKVNSLDQIMLQISDVFAKLPDGAQKAALAQELFGKSGVNLIPLLNQGSEALSKYSATVSTELAQASDKFNDTINSIGIALAGPFNEAVTALLPTITKLAEGLAYLITEFSKLPQPLQSVILVFAGLVLAIGALAPVITAITTGVGILVPILAGIPAVIAGWAGAIGPLVAGLGTLGQILIGVFTGPVGWVALAVAAGIAIYAFRDNIGKAFQAIGQVISTAAKAFYSTFIKPVANWIAGLVKGIQSAFSNIGKFFTAPFQTAAGAVKSIFNGILSSIFGGINKAIGLVNSLIAAYNRLPAPDLPLVPTVSVPAFAAGGMVSGPTLAMVGEAGPEYIIPEHKMAKAAANYLGGLRGRSVIPAFAEGGVVGGMGGGGAANTTVQITTGPVLQQDGQRYVTIGDLEGALQDFSAQIFRNSRSYGGRRYQGAY